LAINAVHQTGKMTDYIEEKIMDDEEDVENIYDIDLTSLMTHLTENLPTEKWDKELRMIGVQI